MKRVISIVLNNFKNDSRVLKENISLQKNGYDVNVVALHEEPLQEFEEVHNIPVHRVKLKSRSWSKNKLIQVFKYFEFVYRVIKTYKQADIFHCNDLNALPIGVLIKVFFNRSAKIVYDAHEYETEIDGLGRVEKKITKFIERVLIKYADIVITVSDTIASEYSKIYNIRKPALVLNTPPYKLINKNNIFRETFDITNEQIIFLCQGSLSRGRGIEILLETFKLFWKDFDESSKSSPVIVFMGYGVLENEIKNDMEVYKNIYFHHAVSPNVLLDYTSSADFGISTIEDVCLSYRYCLPNKMFEYIMAEIPLIVSNLYEMKRLVIDNKIGIVVEKNTSKELKKAISNAMELDTVELNINLQNVKAIYNWEEQEKVLLNCYREI